MDLKDWVQIAGLKEGLYMWYIWQIKFPIQELFHETFKTKEYCQYAGWHCHDPVCKHTHTSKRPREKDPHIIGKQKC